jgi:hypothetical protein
MFCGAYWSQRSESREEAAARIVALLKALEVQHAAFAVGSQKKTRGDDPARGLKVADAEIAKHLHTNRKDIGGNVPLEYRAGTKTPAQLSREVRGMPFQESRFKNWVEVTGAD